MYVAIIGSGVVGRATGEGLQEKGHWVTFYDWDEKVREKLLNEEGHVVADSAAKAMRGADVIMICVPTPASDDGLDLQYVESVLAQVREFRSRGCVTVIRSTVTPYSIGHKLRAPHLIYNPEFLRDKTASYDFLHPISIVIGAYRPDGFAAKIVGELYKDFAAPIIYTTWDNAAFIKLASNAFLATKISFFNELWDIIGNKEDALKVSETLSLDTRRMNGDYGMVGGKSYSGRCIPKDLDALISVGRQRGKTTKILEATKQVNNRFRKLEGLEPE